jgi:hypothetical protein
VFVDRPAHGVLDPDAGVGVVGGSVEGGDPVQQVVGGAGTVGGDQQVASVGGWDLGDRAAEEGDVVGGVVGPGGAGAQLVGEAFAGVVADDGHRVVTVAAAEPAGVLFAGHGVDEVRVDAQHDGLAEVPGGDQRGRDLAVAGDDQVPDPGPDPGGVQAGQAGGVDLGEGAGQGGRGGDLAEEVVLVAEHVDTADGVAAVGHHDRRVGKDPAPVVAGVEVVAVQGVGQGSGQSGAVGEQPRGGSTRVGDDVLAAGGDGRPLRPSGRVMHTKSAFRFGFVLTSTLRFSQPGGTFLCPHETHHIKIVKRLGIGLMLFR